MTSGFDQLNGQDVTIKNAQARVGGAFLKTRGLAKLRYQTVFSALKNRRKHGRKSARAIAVIRSHAKLKYIIPVFFCQCGPNDSQQCVGS
jgi:hypothetical protein